MTRARMLLARAIVLALLLLSLVGNAASAGGPDGGPEPQRQSLPDDPGYGQ